MPVYLYILRELLPLYDFQLKAHENYVVVPWRPPVQGVNSGSVRAPPHFLLLQKFGVNRLFHTVHLIHPVAPLLLSKYLFFVVENSFTFKLLEMVNATINLYKIFHNSRNCGTDLLCHFSLMVDGQPRKVEDQIAIQDSLGTVRRHSLLRTLHQSTKKWSVIMPTTRT